MSPQWCGATYRMFRCKSGETLFQVGKREEYNVGICLSNGGSSVRHQAITFTIFDLLSIESKWTNLIGNLIS